MITFHKRVPKTPTNFWITTVYNRKRLNSSLGYKSLDQFERDAL